MSEIKEEIMSDDNRPDPDGTDTHRPYGHRGRQQRDINDRNEKDGNPDGSDALPLPLPDPRR